MILHRIALTVFIATGSATSAMQSAVEAPEQEAFRFHSGVDLVHVTATVTDKDGRFVSGLGKDDFTVYDDGQRQEITNFSNERVPVSLGILLDTSGSMTPDKMAAARGAIDRFVFDLLGPEDELFFMEFSSFPDLLQEWTTDRRLISRAVARASSAGGTAMYDAVVRALPLAQRGHNQKKALLVISDGNDTNSITTVGELRPLIRESEVMVYALGVDGTANPSARSTPRRPNPPRLPIPFPIPGRGGIPGAGGRWPLREQILFPPAGGQAGWSRRGRERVNELALRSMTDDSGGRTTIVRGFGDLDAATEQIANELSKQYYLGYANSGARDGRWHTITVMPHDPRLTVRARRGYTAS